MRLAGAVVLVTGATSGIGRSTAQVLARRGARVVPTGRDAARLAEVAAEVGDPGLALDLRRPGSADRLVADVLGRHGRLDAVVACAGTGLAGDPAEATEAGLAELVEVNLTAPLQLCRAALPALRQQGRAGGAALLLVTSVAGALGVPGESAYSATKAALETYAEVLREEVRADGVAVSTLLPGVVETEFFARRGRPYDRSFPRPLPAERVAERAADLLESGRPRAVVPRWLALPARVRAVAPRTYRALERRSGQRSVTR